MKRMEYRNDELLYESARLNLLEMRMIGADRMERLLECGSVEDCLRLLAEYGVELCFHPESRAFLREKTLSDRLGQVCNELFESVKDASFLKLWLYPYDCNNFKMILKCRKRGVDCREMLFHCGTVSAEDAYDAVTSHRYELLPEGFIEPVREAAESFAVTGDPQTVDFLLDRACYASMMRTAVESGMDCAVEVLRKKIDLTNLTVCVRLMRMLKPHNRERFLRQAYLPDGSYTEEELARLCAEEESLFWSTLRKGDYARFANAVSGEDASLAEIERAADNELIRVLRELRRGALGAEVLLGYLLGSEYEIRNLRILLSGLEIGLASEALRERIRNSYV